MILERTRHDLRRARAAAVHQHDHRELGPGPGLVGEVLLSLVLEATIRVDDQPRVEEEVGDLDGLREEAPGIVPQVEHEALQPPRLLVERLQRALEVVIGALLELRHPHVAVARLQHLRLDAPDLDDLSRQRDVEELGLGLPLERERHLGVLRAPHLLDGVDEGHVLGELPVDLHDLIAGLEAGAVRRGVLDRRDDGQHAVPGRDLDAEAAEAPLGVDLELLVEVGGEIRAVRIQRGEHSVDGALDELLRLHLVDVVLLDQGQDVGEVLEALVGILRDRTDLPDTAATREDYGQEDGHTDRPHPCRASPADHPPSLTKPRCRPGPWYAPRHREKTKPPVAVPPERGKAAPALQSTLAPGSSGTGEGW